MAFWCVSVWLDAMLIMWNVLSIHMEMSGKNARIDLENRRRMLHSKLNYMLWNWVEYAMHKRYGWRKMKQFRWQQIILPEMDELVWKRKRIHFWIWDVFPVNCILWPTELCSKSVFQSYFRCGLNRMSNVFSTVNYVSIFGIFSKRPSDEYTQSQIHI